MNSESRNNPPPRRKGKQTIRDAVLFAMLGAVMFLFKMVMEGLPNIHPVGMLIMVYTLVWRRKALYPVYIYVFLDGLHWGFDVYWLPKLYVWTVLWGVTMLLPRHMPKWLAPIVYAVVCGLHGLSYGTLLAPMQALAMGLSWKSMWAWILSGIPADVLHCIGNVCMSVLTVPLTALLRRLDKQPT